MSVETAIKQELVKRKYSIAMEWFYKVAKRLVLQQFQHGIDFLMHISGLGFKLKIII